MVRLFKKTILFLIFTSIVTPVAHANYFQSVKNYLNSCKEQVNNYSLPLSLAVATAVSGSCLIGTKNFLELTKNVVGAVPYCAYKVSEQLGPQKTVGITLAALVGLGLKHYYSFYKIENKLINAETIKESNDPNFMFASWHRCYPTHKEIDFNKDILKPQLKSIKNLDEKLKEEKQWLEESIYYVSQYTDLPAKLVVFAIKNLPKKPSFQYSIPDSIDSKRALAVLDQAVQKNITLSDLASTENYLKKECQGHTGSSICYLSQWRWWNPLAISFAPCLPKATQVCMQLFKAYVRVCAFQKLAHEIAGQKAKEKKDIKKKLQEEAKVLVKTNWKDITG